ncbi:MAG TPA: response regulator [Verrucomicrobiae bacterium]|jgi:CheY-like chemotaxis protein|nr:response regulator [Verrucomicrobiae bacterium]
MKSSNGKISGRRILVVDDEPAVCGAIKMMLDFDGHEIRTAGSGKEALSVLEHDKFDVVFTDYSMPEMKGDALAIAIKQNLPNQPVVMITAHADVLKSSGNPLTGVNFLIGKPFLLQDLRTAVARVLPETRELSAEELISIPASV